MEQQPRTFLKPFENLMKLIYLISGLRPGLQEKGSAIKMPTVLDLLYNRINCTYDNECSCEISCQRKYNCIVG